MMLSYSVNDVLAMEESVDDHGGAVLPFANGQRSNKAPLIPLNVRVEGRE